MSLSIRTDSGEARGENSAPARKNAAFSQELAEGRRNAFAPYTRIRGIRQIIRQPYSTGCNTTCSLRQWKPNHSLPSELLHALTTSRFTRRAEGMSIKSLTSASGQESESPPHLDGVYSSCILPSDIPVIREHMPPLPVRWVKNK